MSDNSAPESAIGYIRTARRDACDHFEVMHKAIEKYASRTGYRLEASFHDDGVSGMTTADRPGMDALLQHVLLHDVRICIVNDVGRIARSWPAFFTIIEELHRCGVDEVHLAVDIDAGETPKILNLAEFARTADR